MSEKNNVSENAKNMSDLPYDFGYLKFIESRIQEINELTASIDAPKGNGLVFQRLPRHMRRRVMGHSSKRMPRSVREAHVNQLQKSGFPPKSKKPSRRYRRRPKNLLDEYNRRQRNFIWLETHIWHAKRFHMVERWGYKLALHPCDKSVRACYRASTKHCLLHDLSYLVCIELCGPSSQLLDGLQRMCDPRTGLTFGAVSLLSGQREGALVLYRPDQYPLGALGRITFMWRALDLEGTKKQKEERQLWLWCHPSFYNEVLESLCSVFDLSELQEESPHPFKHPTESVQSAELRKLAPRLAPKAYQDPLHKVTLTLLKDALIRFRLTGSLSHAVLQAALEPAPSLTPTAATPEVTPMDIDQIFEQLEALPAPAQTKSAGSIEEAQAAAWRSGCVSAGAVSSAAVLPPHCIVGLTVVDPRLCLPLKRTKALPENSMLPTVDLAELPATLSESSLWDREARDSATSSKRSDHQLNSTGDKILPSVMDSSDLRQASRVPLLLVQQPGDMYGPGTGVGCGWDVVAPAGWGMPVWRALVLRGARVGGLRELEALSTESRIPQLPHGFPDTAAGCQEMETRRQADTDLHFKRPPDKRLNFIKLGVPCPFGAPWLQLLREWSPETQLGEFYVQRDRTRLREIGAWLQGSGSCQPADPRALVAVAVILDRGGALEPWAQICVPQTPQDLESPPLEPSHPDPTEGQRRESRTSHQAALRSLRRKRVKARLKERAAATSSSEVDTSRSGDLLAEATELAQQQESRVRELWLPSVVPSVRQAASRQCMGFVTQGGFCYSRGKAAGIGFVGESAVLHLEPVEGNQSARRLLVRSRSTLKYRAALVTLLDH